jgi:hypothetical protein
MNAARPALSLEPLTQVHVSAIAARLPAGTYLARHLAQADLDGLCGPHSFAAQLAGDVVAIGGVRRIWQGRAVAWGIAAPLPMRAWPQLTHRVREVLAAARAAGYRRIEATVDPLRADACRWITRLGFEAYGVLENYMPDGAEMIGVVWKPAGDGDERR